MNQSQLGQLSRTYEALASNRSRAMALAVVARQRQTPPAPTGKPSLWFSREREPWRRVSAEIEAAEAAKRKTREAEKAVLMALVAEAVSEVR